MSLTMSQQWSITLCCCLVTKLWLTLCDPMDCSPPASSIHGISQARILEWVVFPSRGDLPGPEIKPMSTALRRIFYRWATRKALNPLSSWCWQAQGRKYEEEGKPHPKVSRLEDEKEIFSRGEYGTSTHTVKGHMVPCLSDYPKRPRSQSQATTSQLAKPRESLNCCGPQQFYL